MRLTQLTQHQNPRGRDGVPRRAPAQVTVYETIIELENITTTQNVSFLVNNTVRYNATYNISYDVSRNVAQFQHKLKNSASVSIQLDECVAEAETRPRRRRDE